MSDAIHPKDELLLCEFVVATIMFSRRYSDIQILLNSKVETGVILFNTMIIIMDVIININKLLGSVILKIGITRFTYKHVHIMLLVG